MVSLNNENIFNNSTQNLSLDYPETDEIFSIQYKFMNEIGKNDSFDFTYSNILYYTDVNSKKKVMNEKRPNQNKIGVINNEQRNIFVVENGIDMNNIKIGRRKIDENHNKKAKHNKFSHDNIIRKIKTQSLDFLVKKLNSCIKFRSGKFRPLNKKMKERLKRDENLELLNKKISDILSNTKMNKISEKRRKSNKKLINKIYNENIEIEVINILSMTFQEFLNDIRDNYLEDFLDLIKEKEIKIQNKIKNKSKDYFDVESYMNLFKKLLFKYEGWFKDKKGRNTKKEDI